MIRRNYYLYDRIGIVIPSINECNNLSVLLHKIFLLYPKAHIVIVDDSLPQEQLKLKKLAKLYLDKHLTFIFRNNKAGRGSAVFDGLKKLLGSQDVECFIEMDADLAHSPDDIVQFLRVREKDLVIGSRYRRQSRIVRWPLYRLVQSKLINLFLRFWLGIRLTDYTNGFRCYSRNAAKYIVSHPLREKGFIALSEIAYRLKNAGFSIAEIPITFTDRAFGESHADIHELLRSVIGAFRIKLVKD